jgi:TRAP-type mannitol/chloroaromatic compound transport system permease large subunit
MDKRLQIIEPQILIWEPIERAQEKGVSLGHGYSSSLWPGLFLRLIWTYL